MSTNYYLRSKEDIRFKIKLDNLLNSFRNDIDNFIHLNEEYSRIEDIEDKLTDMVKEYHWDIDNDIEICTTTSKGITFKYNYLYSTIEGIKELYDSGNYCLINEYNDVFTWEEFLREIEFDPKLDYKCAGIRRSY